MNVENLSQKDRTQPVRAIAPHLRTNLRRPTKADLEQFGAWLEREITKYGGTIGAFDRHFGWGTYTYALVKGDRCPSHATLEKLARYLTVWTHETRTVEQLIRILYKDNFQELWLSQLEDMPFHQWLKVLIESGDRHIYQFAKQFGFYQSTVCSWVYGGVVPRPKYAIALSTALPTWTDNAVSSNQATRKINQAKLQKELAQQEPAFSRNDSADTQNCKCIDLDSQNISGAIAFF